MALPRRLLPSWRAAGVRRFQWPRVPPPSAAAADHSLRWNTAAMETLSTRGQARSDPPMPCIAGAASTCASKHQACPRNAAFKHDSAPADRGRGRESRSRKSLCARQKKARALCARPSRSRVLSPSPRRTRVPGAATAAARRCCAFRAPPSLASLRPGGAEAAAPGTAAAPPAASLLHPRCSR